MSTPEIAASSAASGARTSARPAKHMPGEAGIWVFIMGDMLVFSLFFVTFLYYRGESLELFREAQTHLSQTFGVMNTAFMLTSSWFVAMAVQAARKNLSRVTVTCFSLAMVCGAGFIINKFFEYSEKIRAGLTLTSNDFFMYYYMFTGIHLLHVVIGMVVLAFITRYSMSGGMDKHKISIIESGASFWHVVDLLWIVLFALLYLVK